MRWWWISALLMGIGVAGVALAFGRDIGYTVGVGTAGFIGGLIAGGVKYLGWLGDARLPAEPRSDP